MHKGPSSLITVRLSDTISKVKKKIKNMLPRDPEGKLLLKFGNKILQDNLTVFDYNIQIGSTVFTRIIYKSAEQAEQSKKRQE